MGFGFDNNNLIGVSPFSFINIDTVILPNINKLYKGINMFSCAQKRKISDEIQKILRATNHPELPDGEIQFHLHVKGRMYTSWADIQNNGNVPNPTISKWNESQAKKCQN